MSVRRLILAVGAVLLLAGVIGLLVPVKVANSNGGSISCGNGIVSDYAGARAANNGSVANIPILNDIVPHTDYVAACESSLSSRRAWTIPLTVIGLLAVAGPLLVRRSRGAPAGV
ncbi:aminopeptidase [Mycobacterium asiaticum]|uniref:Aminopeptidase n=1 Tax=Mycobacterium asiaticum TaxID=1790 RepID=A0A1A3MZX1_MYCAS|nr:aminopeptidase [Mycobacterium asiaticum]OBI88852.1 aminopeptidase [Mycobacterium asiaticum]OBK15443.1 aminopeptidase [Mycobacterium asiaticum]OBK92035.1 aminopeptidase [Mycobacterium asiaticum]